MRKAVFSILFFCVMITFAGCYQVSSNGDDFRTTPITNNPNLIPNEKFGSHTAAPF